MADTTISSLNTVNTLSANNFIPISDGITTTKLGTDSLFGFRNRIINGDMRIDQRNAGAISTYGNGTVAGNYYAYALDRWLAQAYTAAVGTGFVITGQKSALSPPGFTNSAQLTVTSNLLALQTGHATGLTQVIEGYNIGDLNFGTNNAQSVTVSFWVRSSVTGTFGASLRNGETSSNPSRSYAFSYNITTPNTWEYKTIVIPGDTTGTWHTDNRIGLSVTFSIGAGATFSGVNNMWQNGNLYQPVGSTSLITAPNGSSWNITGVQLEAGPTATPFEHRPIGTELALCQRYFSVLDSGRILCVSNGGVPIVSAKLPQTMRTSSTCTLYGGNSLLGNVGVYSSGPHTQTTLYYPASSATNLMGIKSDYGSDYIAFNLSGETSNRALTGWSNWIDLGTAVSTQLKIHATADFYG